MRQNSLKIQHVLGWSIPVYESIFPFILPVVIALYGQWSRSSTEEPFHRILLVFCLGFQDPLKMLNAARDILLLTCLKNNIDLSNLRFYLVDSQENTTYPAICMYFS